MRPGSTSGRLLASQVPEMIAHTSGLASQAVAGSPLYLANLLYSCAVIWWADWLKSVPPLTHVCALALLVDESHRWLAAERTPPGIRPLSCPFRPLPVTGLTPLPSSSDPSRLVAKSSCRSASQVESKLTGDMSTSSVDPPRAALG